MGEFGKTIVVLKATQKKKKAKARIVLKELVLTGVSVENFTQLLLSGLQVINAKSLKMVIKPVVTINLQ